MTAEDQSVSRVMSMSSSKYTVEDEQTKSKMPTMVQNTESSKLSNYPPPQNLSNMRAAPTRQFTTVDDSTDAANPSMKPKQFNHSQPDLVGRVYTEPEVA